MGIGELLALLGVLVLIAFIRRRGWKDASNFPPGPFELPVLGHLYLFLHLPHQALRDVSTRYGHVVGLRLGQQKAVVLSSPELAKQVLLTLDKLFADRPPLAFTSIMYFGSTNGVVFSRYGPQWRKHRRICALHLFTSTRLRELQYVRQQEISALLFSLHHQSCAGTRAVDLGKCVGRMTSHLLTRLLQSRPTAYVGDENLQELVQEGEHDIGPTWGDLVPSLSWLDFFRKLRMRRLHARFDKVCTEMIMERRESTSAHKDLLQYLLSEEEPLTMDEVKGILNDMIGAGIQTLPLTLEWVMAELLRNPQCLRRLQREIDTWMGEKRQITDEDLPNLSYLKWVVKEALRLHPIAPLLIPRMSLEECQIQGYTIPARTLVFVNVWAIGRDEQVWSNADMYMPERFENLDVDLKGQHFELLPFGSGRRSCLGLPLALSVIELTVANLVSWFDWELPNGEAHTSINMDEKMGLTANKATPVVAIPKARVSSLEMHIQKAS